MKWLKSFLILFFSFFNVAYALEVTNWDNVNIDSFQSFEKYSDIAVQASNVFNGGSGTSSNPYQIATAEQLALLASYINTSSTNGTYASKYYVLTDDIDLSEYSSWTPIGFNNNIHFKGHFDGKGHIIKNMRINIDSLNKSYKVSYGLFGSVTNTAEISNVELVDSEIALNLSEHAVSTKDIDIGMLVGRIDNNVTVINCIVRNSNIHVYDTFELGSSIALKIGGMIGDAGDASSLVRNLKMENLFSNVDITVDDSVWGVNGNTNKYYQFIIGGIVGRLRVVQNFPKNSVYKGTITANNAFIGPTFSSYRYTEGSAFADFSNMYVAYSASTNSNPFDDSNFFYNYVINGVEIKESYKTDLFSRNVNDISGNPITIYTLGNESDSSSVDYMKNYQGVNRGDYIKKLNSKLVMFNNYVSNNDASYDYNEWYYSAINDVYSFSRDNEGLEIVNIEDFTYEARMLDSEGLTYKWYVNDVLQVETSNTITIDFPTIDIYLKVEVYDQDVMVGCVEKLIEEFKLEVSLIKELSENNLDRYRVNYENISSDNPVINNYEFVWYEILKDNATGEYRTNLLPYTSDSFTVSNSAYAYKLLLINCHNSRYNKELIYVNDDIKYVFVNYEAGVNDSGIYYERGNDNNNGDSPEHAVRTLKRAYDLLSSNGTVDNQYIIIMGKYLGGYQSVKYNLNKNSSVFTKEAFITGNFLGTEYYGNLYINVDNYFNANTSFENITISSLDTSDYFFYAQGNDMYLGKNINMDILGVSSNTLVGTKAPAFNIIAGFLDYSVNNYTFTKTCHIVVKSGYYARILGGNRNTGNYNSYNNKGLAFDPLNPFNVIIDIDIENSTNPNDYNYDVNLLVGGQTDGSSYLNTVINILNGNIGRVVGGSQGYGHTTSGNYPVDSFFGSVTTNISGGVIGQLYSGSLGRNAPTSYFFGKMVTNITGGLIEENIFGSGAGGVSGFSNDRSKYDATFDVVKRLVTDVYMADIDGNLYRLDKATSIINISGGTIEGSVYGGGYGYSTMLPEAENIAVDGGSLYGDVFVNISGGTIEGSVYGGGRGTDLYGDARDELAKVYGDVSINITGSPTINGNIYAGSEGLSDYPDMAMINGDVSLYIEGEQIEFDGNIYGGSHAGTIEGNIELDIGNVSTTGKIYGGGNAGNVFGSVSAIIDNVSANELYGGGDSGIILGSVDLTISNSVFSGNIYGGCNSGDVYQTVALDITETEAVEVYGGGLSGNISEFTTITHTISDIEGRDTNVTSSVIINSGNYQNVFGGGNLGKVFGDTYVKVGNTNTYTDISGVVYGGGRGTGSEFETVSGSSNVLITGKNTRVNNYGSIQLGKVTGDVYLIFRDYYVNNPTNRYKIMNGIDRATTVTFDNSYVLLENIINGELRGIEDIQNIVLPAGSGLKISANGHITGDFTGGGKLYLDSAVCMTIDGDISGSTTLILNPTLANSNTSTIIGSIDNPYMIVKGESEATEDEEEAISLVSAPGEEYTILTQKSELTNNFTYYYIADTVSVNDFISEVTINTKDKKFTSIFNEVDDITILNNKSFTSAINMTISFLDDGKKGNKFKDIYRTLTLVDGDDDYVYIPEKTNIIMIYDNVYYYYVVSNSTDEINLGDFTSFQGNSFSNNFSIEDVDPKYYTENDLTRLYTYSEDYRFIFDFSNCDTYITESNYVKLNIIDNDELQEIDNHQTNMINYLGRSYSFSSEFKSELVTRNDLVVETTINVSALPKNTVVDAEYLGLRLMLLDEDDNIINFPPNTEVIIGSSVYMVRNGIVTFKLTNDLLNANAINKKVQFKLDVSNVLLQDKLENGNYKMKFEYGFTRNDILNENVKYTEILPFSVNNHIRNEFIRNYGLRADLVIDNNISNEKLVQDKQKWITYGSEETRTIRVQYNSILSTATLLVKGMVKNGDLDHFINCNDISFDINRIDLEDRSVLTRNIHVTFDENLEEGIYRVYFNLLDENDQLLTSDYVNFVVSS